MKRALLFLLFFAYCSIAIAVGNKSVMVSSDTVVSVCKSEVPLSWRDKLYPESGTFFDTVVHAEGDTVVDTLVLMVFDTIESIIISPSSQSLCRNGQPQQLDIAPFTYDIRDSVLFQWYESFNGNDFQPIVGEVNASYQPLADTVDRYFKVIVSSKQGCKPVSSNSVLVHFYDKFHAGSVSLNNPAIICENTAPSNPFHSEANPSGGSGRYGYQWEFHTQSSDWTPIPGAIQPDYPSPAISEKTWFRRSDIDTVCNDTVRTNAIVIDVYEIPTKPYLVPYNGTICFDSVPHELSVATISHCSSEDSIIYSWEYSIDGRTFISLNDSGLVYRPLSGLQDTTYYRVKAFTSRGCGSIYSDTIRVCVYEKLGVSLINGDSEVCYNSPAQLSVAAYGVNGQYNYQWYRTLNPANDDGWMPVGNDNNVYNSEAQSSACVFYYKCRVTSISGCGFVETSPFSVETKTDLMPGSIAGADTICYAYRANPITSLVPASGSFGQYNSYYWEKKDISSVNWTSIKNENGANLSSPGVLYRTTIFRRAAYNSHCDVTKYDSVTIYVLDSIESPIIAPVAVSDSICYGDDYVCELTMQRMPQPGPGESFEFEWSDSIPSDPSRGWHPVDTAAVFFPRNLTETRYYRVLTISSSGCNSTPSQYVKINVMKPLFVEVDTDTTVNLCYDDSTKIIIHAEGAKGGTSYSYQWKQSLDKKNWTSAENADSRYPYLRTNNHIASTYYYQCMVKDEYCGDSAYSKVITVTTDAKIDAGKLSEPNSRGFCYGDTVPELGFSTPASGPIESMLWQKKDKGDKYWSDASYPNSRETYSPGPALTDTTWFRVRLVNGSCDTAYTDPIKVCINPLPKKVDILCDSSVVCTNGLYVFKFPSSDYTDKYSYTWSVVQSDGKIEAEQIQDSQYEVKWKEIPSDGLSEVQLEIKDTMTGCVTVCPYTVSVEQGVDSFEILRKRGSNILYCPTCDSSYYFTWQKDNYVICEGTDKRYIVVDDNLDLPSSIFSLKLEYKKGANCFANNYFRGGDDRDKIILKDKMVEVATQIDNSIQVWIENPNELQVTVSLFSVSGAIIGSYDLGKDPTIEKQIPVNLTRGVYMLRVEIGNEVSTVKLIAE